LSRIIRFCVDGFSAEAIIALSFAFEDERGFGLKMMNRNKRKEILAGFFQEVWNDGNIEAADKYLASKYTIHHDPGDPWDKKELDLQGFKDRVRRSRAPFPAQRFFIQELFADGNAVVATWLWKGRHAGDISDFPASGREITMSGITVYYFEGDRIAGHWQVVDRLGVFQQLRQKLGQAQ
jgi:steroid delta-isomerase-like uncharacterized protein